MDTFHSADLAINVGKNIKNTILSMLDTTFGV